MEPAPPRPVCYLWGTNTPRMKGPGWGSRGQGHPLRTPAPQSSGWSPLGRGRKRPWQRRRQAQGPRVLWERGLCLVPDPILTAEPMPVVHQGKVRGKEPQCHAKEPKVPSPNSFRQQPQAMEERSPRRKMKPPEHPGFCGPPTP